MPENNIQDEFIATVSHEMRTPLTSIRGFSQTLLSSWDRLDEDSKKKFVKIIGEQSNRLINLVENILTASKIHSDKVSFRGIDVNNSIEKIIQLLSQKYPNHKIVSEFNEKLPLVKLDEEKFQQVITNLLDNACKYSEEGKTVVVLTNFLDSDNVVISIKDEGVGIQTGDKQKVYDKFFRLENHLTSKTQGNGLGLYITKKLVEMMDGKINYTSEVGKGTTFTIIFPFYSQEEALQCSRQS